MNNTGMARRCSTCFKYLVLLISLAIVSGGCISGQGLTAQPPTQRTDYRLIAGINDLAYRLFSTLFEEQRDGNVFFSPFSVYLALIITSGGAEAETREAMVRALGVNTMTREDINQGLINLLNVLENPDPRVQLSIANSLWLKENYPIKPSFIQGAQELRALVSSLDFSDPGAPARINDWVKGTTAGKIPSIVDSIDPLTILFVINAIHFQGTWTNQFNPDQTHDGIFYPASGGQLTLPMMNQRSTFDYLDIDQVQIIRLPYGQENVSMLIFLPDMVGSSLDEVVSRITIDGWKEWLDQMETQPVSLTLPRFSVQFQANLNEVLKGLGMEIAFDPNRANFSGIVEPPPDAFISRVAHRAYLAVGEQGTEAAAVTSVEVGVTSAPTDEITMVVDRPFLCVILDDITGVILFMGAIQHPE